MYPPLSYRVLNHFKDRAYKLERDKIMRAIKDVFGPATRIGHGTSEDGAHFIYIEGDVSDESDWSKVEDVHMRIGLRVTHVVLRPYYEDEPWEAA